jgi:hypothetical protein
MEGFTIANIIKVGIQRGLKNLVPVLVNTVLWIVTIWIPYLNVGTTIGLWVGVIAKMSRDEEISMTEIFNPAYRKRMGQYFLVWGFMMAGIMMGMIFLYIPGIVIAIAWMLAPLLVIDKEVPGDADPGYRRYYRSFHHFLDTWQDLWLSRFLRYNSYGHRLHSRLCAILHRAHGSILICLWVAVQIGPILV